jgi:uncharacterized Fe-S cluster protein YjdI
MRKTYASNDIAVSYDARRCIHAERCVHGAPETFDPRARPWIQPGKSEADRLAAVVAECPTGALRYERLDGGPAEAVAPEVTITFEKDGPISVRGAMPLSDGAGNLYEDAGARYALCRCGGSGNKPFCDGTHRSMGFEDQ